MKKLEKLLLLFVLIAGIISCSDDDEVPAYESVLINQAASDGLYGQVKSVEFIDYESSWDYNKEEITVGNIQSKTIKTYDKKGVVTSEAYYWGTTDKGELRMINKESYQYDSKYRVVQYEEEYLLDLWNGDAYEYGDIYEKIKVEISYDDKNKKATVVIWNWDSENSMYYKNDTRIHELKPNGTLDIEILEYYNNDREIITYYPTAKNKEQQPDWKTSRVIVKEDGKNWTESYILHEYFNDGGGSDKYGNYYEKRVINYY